MVGHTHPQWEYFSIIINGAMHDPKFIANRRLGWLYMGYSNKFKALKIGGTRKCPLCRMSNTFKLGDETTHIKPIGVSFSEDWRINEQKLLGTLGKPKYGNEWFEPEGRARFVFKTEWMFSIKKIEARCIGLIFDVPKEKAIT